MRHRIRGDGRLATGLAAAGSTSIGIELRPKRKAFLAANIKNSPSRWERRLLLASLLAVARPSAAVTRGLDPRVHLLRIDFAKMMDARVKPAHDGRVDQIDREPL
jgi:hypothetical protein